jgi:signal peptidase I
LIGNSHVEHFSARVVLLGMNKTLRRFWKNWIKPLLVIGLITGSLRSAVADWNDVPTGSMKPTILEGDRIVVNKLAYDLKVPFTTWHLAEWGNPKRGDIAVFYSPADGKRLVKRVIGLPGDSISMENNRIFVNRQPVEYGPLETAMSNPVEIEAPGAHQFATENLDEHRHAVMATPALNAMRSFATITVPKESYFMMGDNRDNSFDSRYFGVVPRQKIVGRATAVAISLNRNRYYLPRTDRFCEKLQ